MKKYNNKKIVITLVLFGIPIIYPVLTITHPKCAIIIGASKGMGREVAKLLAADGYTVGLASRNIALLKDVQQHIPTPSYIKQMDMAQHNKAVEQLQELIEEMGGLDLLVIAATGHHEVDQSKRDWKEAQAIFDVNIVGFYALARTGLNFFMNQGHGHLVGFSSISGLRGVAQAPSYSASKAFCSRYMESERNYFIQNNIPITVTDIMPGWVNSTQDPHFKKKHPDAYWFETLEDATQEIMQAIKNKVPIAYITKRWEKVAEMLRTMPDDLYNALDRL